MTVLFPKCIPLMIVFLESTALASSELSEMEVVIPFGLSLNLKGMCFMFHHLV